MPVVVETERLLLREMLLNDLEPLGAIMANPVVMRYYREPFTPERTRGWIVAQQTSYREHGFGLWAVVHRESATFLGQAGLRSQDVDGVSEVELGYMLDEPAWRQGFGKEAATAVLDHAFRALGIPRVVAIVHPKNTASRRTAESAGMLHEKDAEVFGSTHAIYSLEAKPNER